MHHTHTGMHILYRPQPLIIRCISEQFPCQRCMAAQLPHRIAFLHCILIMIDNNDESLMLYSLSAHTIFTFALIRSHRCRTDAWHVRARPIRDRYARCIHIASWNRSATQRASLVNWMYPIGAVAPARHTALAGRLLQKWIRMHKCAAHIDLNTHECKWALMQWRPPQIDSFYFDFRFDSWYALNNNIYKNRHYHIIARLLLVVFICNCRCSV